MRQIVAIGGGGFTQEKGALKLEKYILALAKKPDPNICFLPQASNEAPEYIVKFYENFLKLGASPSWISLFGRVEASWKDKVLKSDIIYVGGGNTRSMLALWKEWGLDQLIQQAYHQGTILCGVSAGAICWFEEAITDSVWPLGAVKGLGMLKGSACPHYDSEMERPGAYRSLLASKQVQEGIALEDHTAAHYINESLDEVISSVEGQRAFNVTLTGDIPITVRTI
jgi:dipeptidase E